MMDSDEFDDDILDEDLILAASQAPPARADLAKPPPGRPPKAPRHVPGTNGPSRAPLTVGRFRLLMPMNIEHDSMGDMYREAVPLGVGYLCTAVVSLRVHHSALLTTLQARAGALNPATSSAFIDLEDLPSDAFSSSPPRLQAALPARNTQQSNGTVGQAANYRQTTLFGGSASWESHGPQSAQGITSNRAFRVDLPAEAPTHHAIDLEAMKTWVYPTNLGPIRDYQFSIVNAGLFNNTLVALPTGLGKTFIAATIMLNFYRWTKSAKLVFVAPTKPLVSQQVDACFNIAGIPRSQTTLLTGEVSPALRAEEWTSKRVFFMTPQTLENDLSSGAADPKSIGLLVVDEAHRATGNYAYVKVVTFIRRFSKSFRILALTATPGSSVEAVQEVVDGLGISHVEIRTEDSIDIRQYVHARDEIVEVLDPSEEMLLIKDLFAKALKPLVDRLSSQNIYYGRDPMAITTYGLMQARKEYFARAGHANQGVKFVTMTIFSILQSLAHSIKLLNFHGIKPFYENLVQFRDETESKGEKGSKFKRQVVDSPDFQKMMSMVGTWAKNDDFVSHPKLAYLSNTVLGHFMDAGDGREGHASSNTRIIVFSEFRDSAEEIVRVLNRHKPMVRAAVFVGQADTKKSEGMKQAEQIERIKKFKDGTFNILVATSIGEEGLDIGQVDLIICYDASASPIRMLQRMGRTGRKRAGKVVLLLMRGKEEDNFNKSKDGYNKMQSMICDGRRFNFRHDLSTRIVPRDVKPEVDKRMVEIPIENTQNQSLPEPKKGRAAKKKPPKKFHMPDDVETGFASVATMLGKKKASKPAPPTLPSRPVETDELAEIPSVERVVLDDRQSEELRRSYRDLPFFQHKVEEIETADLTAHPVAQRTLSKTVLVKHGEHTKRCVKLFRKLYKSQSSTDRYDRPFGDVDRSHFEEIPAPDDISERDLAEPTEPPQKRRKVAQFHDDNDELEEAVALPARTTKPKKPQPQQKKGLPAQRRPSPVREVEQREVLVIDSSQHKSPEVILHQLSPPKARKRARKAEGGGQRKKTQSLVYDESADEGDDCRRTSDLEPTDDSDDGSDLVGFVVGDDVATSSLPPTSSLVRSTSPMASSAPSTRRRGSIKSRRHQLSQLSATQESDDSFPSMSQITTTQRRRASSESTDDVEVDQRAVRGNRKRVVYDDDSDE